MIRTSCSQCRGPWGSIPDWSLEVVRPKNTKTKQKLAITLRCSIGMSFNHAFIVSKVDILPSYSFILQHIVWDLLSVHFFFFCLLSFFFSSLYEISFP